MLGLTIKSKKGILKKIEIRGQSSEARGLKAMKLKAGKIEK